MSALQVSAYVAFYKSRPDFNGDDAFVLEVKFADGKTVIYPSYRDDCWPT